MTLVYAIIFLFASFFAIKYSIVAFIYVNELRMNVFRLLSKKDYIMIIISVAFVCSMGQS